jgi:hypothetical protein
LSPVSDTLARGADGPTEIGGTVGITLINQSSAISDSQIEYIAEACNMQLQNEVAKAWGIRSPLVVSTTHRKTSYPFFFVDTIPEAPGALAYHFVQDDGVPAGKIGVQTTLDAGESVESATSHETVELQCDIFCATWSWSSALGCLVATEACDPVQNETYTMKVSDGTTVPVSNFVTPYYFTDDPLGKPVDHLGNLSKPFDISPGGYQIRMKGGRVTDHWGKAASTALQSAKHASQGRTFWRHVTMAIALSQGPA